VQFEAGGTDDVCEWWLVSTSADLFIRDAGPLGPNILQLFVLFVYSIVINYRV